MNAESVRTMKSKPVYVVDNEQANPYGCVHLNLQTALYKQGRYSQMQFNFYLACRMSMPKWVFNESDIRTMTGIHRKMVSGHCRALVKAGIFTPCGWTEHGSPQYTLDKRRFQAYLKGTEPLDPVETPEKPACSSCLPLSSNDSPPCHRMIAPLSPNDSPPYHRMIANKEEKKEEEKEDTHSRGVRECCELFSDQAKQAKAANEVREPLAGPCSPPSSGAFQDALSSAIASGFPFAVHCSASTGTWSSLAPGSTTGNPSEADIAAKMAQILVPMGDESKEAQERSMTFRAEWEARQKEREERRQKEQQERINRAEEVWAANQIESPSQDKEMIADLGADEKVQVLKAAIETMNQNGDFDHTKGSSHHYNVVVTKKSLGSRSRPCRAGSGK